MLQRTDTGDDGLRIEMCADLFTVLIVIEVGMRHILAESVVLISGDGVEIDEVGSALRGSLFGPAGVTVETADDLAVHPFIARRWRADDHARALCPGLTHIL